MKELYISPEVELIGFVAEERLANNNNVNFGDLDGDKVMFPGVDNSATSEAGDIRLPFPKL